MHRCLASFLVPLLTSVASITACDSAPDTPRGTPSSNPDTTTPDASAPNPDPASDPESSNDPSPTTPTNPDPAPDPNPVPEPDSASEPDPDPSPDPDPPLPTEPTFLVIDPLPIPAADLGDGTLPTTQTATTLAFAGEDGVDFYGVSSYSLGDPIQRLGAQAFHFSIGEGTTALDDSTPWKLIRHASRDGKAIVAQRGAGPASAIGFTWRRTTGAIDFESHGGHPLASSGDGSVVVGTTRLASGLLRAFRWTEASGPVELEPPAGIEETYATSVDESGTAVFGILLPVASDSDLVVSTNPASQPFRWTQALGTEPLGTLPAPDGFELAGCLVAVFVAARGDAAAGTCSFSDPETPLTGGTWSAFTWSAGAGITSIPHPDAFEHGKAIGMSADGSAVFGQAWTDSSAETRVFRWTPETGSLALESPFSIVELVVNEATHRLGVSRDGKVAVVNAAFDEQSFIWTESSGVSLLRPLSGHTRTRVTDLSPDGSVAAGFSETEAVLWDQSGEPRSIRTLLEAAGEDLVDFSFSSPPFPADVRITNGGRIAYGSGETRAWIAVLP